MTLVLSSPSRWRSWQSVWLNFVRTCRRRSMRWQKPRPRADSDRFLPSNDIIDIQIKPFERIRDSLWLLGPNRLLASFRSECWVEFGAGTIWDSHSLCWSWGSLQCSHANSSSPGCFCIFDKAACPASSEPWCEVRLSLVANGKWQMDYSYRG